MPLRLSEKHGVNPSLSVCFWCGGDKNEIILRGAMRGDVEAPRKAVWNYEPCDECKAKFSQGVHIVEVVTYGNAPANSAPIQGDPKNPHGCFYPTGRMVVITNEACLRIFDDEMGKQCVKEGRALMEPDSFQMLFGDVEDTEGGDENEAEIHQD